MTELGTIETPILLTNTLNVGVAADALIDYMLERNPEIGRTTGTVNPLVGECNDMFLNDVRAKIVKAEHILIALEIASSEFEEGTVGAGTGMLCYSLKGGIGSASRKCWIAIGSALILLAVGLWNADLLKSEKGFYSMAYVLSLFAAVSVQKNIRDMNKNEEE
jgi:D-aminopeptidase